MFAGGGDFPCGMPECLGCQEHPCGALCDYADVAYLPPRSPISRAVDPSEKPAPRAVGVLCDGQARSGMQCMLERGHRGPHRSVWSITEGGER